LAKSVQPILPVIWGRGAASSAIPQPGQIGDTRAAIPNTFAHDIRNMSFSPLIKYFVQDLGGG
jgi:hypothetical protein